MLPPMAVLRDQRAPTMLKDHASHCKVSTGEGMVVISYNIISLVHMTSEDRCCNVHMVSPGISIIPPYLRSEVDRTLRVKHR